jgi:intron-binding protein aquarius
MSKEEADRANFYSQVLWRLMGRFKNVLDSIDAVEESFDVHALAYVEKFVLLLIDLEAQLTTRRFVHVLIDASQVIIHSTLSQFYLSEPGTLFYKLLQLLIFYSRFEVDDFTGYALSISDISQRHYEFVNQMQVYAYRRLGQKAKDFYLLNVGSVDNRVFLSRELKKWNVDELYQIALDLNLVLERTEGAGDEEKYLYNADYLREIIVSNF